MNKIIIKLPNKDSKWKITIKGGTRTKSSASAIYNRIETYLIKLSENLCVTLKDKMMIVMKTSNGTTFNQSLSSNDCRYLLLITVCFMEDYLDKRTFNKKYKLYG